MFWIGPTPTEWKWVEVEVYFAKGTGLVSLYWGLELQWQKGRLALTD